MPSDVVLITGSTGGIGSATVTAFTEAGFTVVGYDRVHPDDAVDAGLVPEGSEVSYEHHVTGDITDESRLGAAVALACELGELRHVVGVAGGAEPGENVSADPLAVSLELFTSVIASNLVGQWALLRCALPALRASSGNRSVTFTSSINARVGVGLHAYSAGKADIESLVRTTGVALGAEGIRVNAVAPGTVRTPRTSLLWADTPGHFERMDDTVPLGAAGSCEDIAATYVAIATTLRHVNATTLVVDGGQLSRWR